MRLTFNGEPLEMGTTVMVTDLDGGDHAVGTSLDARDVVTQLGDLPDGHYDIRWRVVSSDGHPISGVIPFSVGDAGERPAQEPVPPPQAEETGTEPPSTPTPGLPGPVRTALVGVGGAMAALLLVWVIGRVRRRP